MMTHAGAASISAFRFVPTLLYLCLGCFGGGRGGEGDGGGVFIPQVLSVSGSEGGCRVYLRRLSREISRVEVIYLFVIFISSGCLYDIESVCN
jgi:hypothetical protein